MGTRCWLCYLRNVFRLEPGTWKKAVHLGLAIATFFIIILYVTFTFSYTELACAIPKAGGAFDYANRAMGKDLGLLPEWHRTLNSFLHPLPSHLPSALISIYFFRRYRFCQLPSSAYIVFTALNIYGVKAAASFELIITILAVGELLLFAGVTLPHFEVKNLQHNAFPNGWEGVFASIPFAIWFFLAIEGVANVAEEAISPQRTIFLVLVLLFLHLVILCILTFVGSVGVAGWEAIVYKAGWHYF